jgi:hypothetical protein
LDYGSHSTTMSGPNGERLGSVMSRVLPAWIEALPVGEARFDACDAHRDANRTEAYAAILAAFPEATDGKRDRLMGTIEIEV